jgi:uncharacterized protein YkwD
MNFILACALLFFSFSSAETDLVAAVNRERLANGVPQLAVNWEIARLARYRAEEMVKLEFFGHESRIYGCTGEMLTRNGIAFAEAGVKIAKGQECAEEVLNAWLSSDAHREVLLNPEYTAAGVGLAFDDDIPYWTLILISST